MLEYDKLRDHLDTMKSFFDSEEGQKWIEQEKEKDRLHLRRKERVKNYILSHSFEQLMDRMLKEHDWSYRAKLWNSGVIPYPNHKFSLLLEFVREYGTTPIFDLLPHEEEDEMMEYQNYRFREWGMMGYGLVVSQKNKQGIWEEIFQIG